MLRIIPRLGEAESFRALVDRFEKIRSQLIVGFVDGQVELIEAGRRKFLIKRFFNEFLNYFDSYHVWADGKRSVERSSR